MQRTHEERGQKDGDHDERDFHFWFVRGHASDPNNCVNHTCCLSVLFVPILFLSSSDFLKDIDFITLTHLPVLVIV